MGIILSLLRVLGWKTEEDEAQRIKPRKTAGTLLPLENPTPKPNDHHPLKQALLISNSNADSHCQNIHVFSRQCLEQNQEYSRQTKNTKDSVTISIPSFSTHVLDSNRTSSITDTDSTVITQENTSRKNVSYAEHEETAIRISTDQICEESGDQCLEQNQEYQSQVKNIVDYVTISIPKFSDHHALDYSTSSSTNTDSAAIIQENTPQKMESYAHAVVVQENVPQKDMGICISTEKKCEESSEEKEIERKNVIESTVVVEKPRWRSIKHYSSRHHRILEKEIERKKVIESTVVVEKPRWIRHYSSRHRILLVGEGDFSFSCSLAVAFGCTSKIIATSLDSQEFLKKNYAKAPRNIGELKRRGCIVIHGIDATTIATQQLLQHKTFDRIIYNFPHAGFFKGLSRDSTLRLHRRLVSLFLKNAKDMIDENGEIHISHKTNGYHCEWNLVNIASSHGLRLIEEVEFDLSDYPGYNTKRGFGGDENFDCYPSSTFKFGLKFVGHGYAKCYK